LVLSALTVVAIGHVPGKRFTSFEKGLEMRKLLAMLLALVTVAPVTIGCGDKKKEQQKTKSTVETEKDPKKQTPGTEDTRR
jgi:hypothetical protein